MCSKNIVLYVRKVTATLLIACRALGTVTRARARSPARPFAHPSYSSRGVTSPGGCVARPDDDSVAEADEEDAAEALPRSSSSLLRSGGRDRATGRPRGGSRPRARPDLDRSVRHPLDFIASRRGIIIDRLSYLISMTVRNCP